ncbi:PepSY domain-containing protein [Chitinimonas sp. BJYL2]|uniref:PepSY domain-containing protein n=1 Tax=Chitinimonas sp. BJYL2 TaxID=2976696 RepID=UPI0022B4AAEF|nr:PepSY domain-containing protein [Chitinimonas sp. BJYL2]
MKTLIACLLTTFSAAALASPVCTSEPKDRWQAPEQFQQKLKADGYQIKKFKVLDHCYEIYGHDKAGRKVEIYFDPVKGLPVKQRIES